MKRGKERPRYFSSPSPSWAGSTKLAISPPQCQFLPEGPLWFQLPLKDPPVGTSFIPPAPAGGNFPLLPISGLPHIVCFTPDSSITYVTSSLNSSSSIAHCWSGSVFPAGSQQQTPNPKSQGQPFQISGDNPWPVFFLHGQFYIPGSCGNSDKLPVPRTSNYSTIAMIPCRNA